MTVLSRLKGPIAIFGAGGFIGTNLCRHFNDLGSEVVALERPHGASWRLLATPTQRRISVDLTDKSGIKKVLRDLRPSVVINCAAYGAYSSQRDADRIYQVNFEGVRNLLESLEASPELVAFIQAGSSSEYGRNCRQPSEESSTVPDSHYAVSKVAASSLVQYFGKSYGVPAWVGRIYSAYGPFEEITRLIPSLLLAVMKGGWPPLVNRLVSRDFIYVDDLARAFAKIIEGHADLPRGDIFNLGTGKKTTIKDLVAIAARQFRVVAEPNWGSMAERDWDHADWFADPSKAERAFGWSAEIDLATGLQRTMNWLSEHPDLVNVARQNSILGDHRP